MSRLPAAGGQRARDEDQRSRPARRAERAEHHGIKALRHWHAYLPASYRRLEDPVQFFTDLGEQADAEIEDRYACCPGSPRRRARPRKRPSASGRLIIRDMTARSPRRSR
jgi:hypothetical protein